MAGYSPTQLTLRKLRADGWPLIEVVEHWNPHARRRQDLFGIIDVLAVSKHGQVIAIQATSRANASNRKAKLAESDALPHLLAARWLVEVWGWDKKNGRWQLGRRVDMRQETKQ